MRRKKKALRFFLLVSAGWYILTTRCMARTFEESSLAVQGGMVIASALVSVPYFVSKMLYAVNGSIVAGGINVLSLGMAQNLATTVGCQAVNGGWIVHPKVFTGERKLTFVGREEPITGLSLTVKEKE